MKASRSGRPRVPVILVHESSGASFRLFNPNDWTGLSRQLVASCAAQFGLLTHTAARMPGVLREGKELCKARFKEREQEWSATPWDLDACAYLVEVPEYHTLIQAYVSTVKVLLDLLAQLVSTEGVVVKRLHGFHKKGREIGGQLLDTLDVKAAAGKRDVADALLRLVRKHKSSWIDRAVGLRDDLVHPEKGVWQVMFGLRISQCGSRLRLGGIPQPSVDGVHFPRYARTTLRQMSRFSTRFLYHLKAG